MRALFIALLALIWLILGWLFYKDHHSCCSQIETVPISNVEVIHDNGPLLFNWASAVPLIGDGWPKMRDSLQNLLTDSSKMVITGYYFTGIQPPETESIGLERASAIKSLFKDMDDKYFELRAESADCDSTYKIKNFIAHNFSYAAITKEVVPKNSSTNVVELPEGTLIYFPYNSTDKLNDEYVETYLLKVAKYLKSSNATISLIGHTDDKGNDASNMALGMKRAEVIKKFLVENGVEATRIITESKGETSPISDNTTAKGRKENRRTEIKIIQ